MQEPYFIRLLRKEYFVNRVEQSFLKTNEFCVFLTEGYYLVYSGIDEMTGSYQLSRERDLDANGEARLICASAVPKLALDLMAMFRCQTYQHAGALSRRYVSDQLMDLLGPGSLLLVDGFWSGACELDGFRIPIYYDENDGMYACDLDHWTHHLAGAVFSFVRDARSNCPRETYLKICDRLYDWVR